MTSNGNRNKSISSVVELVVFWIFDRALSSCLKNRQLTMVNTSKAEKGEKGEKAAPKGGINNSNNNNNKSVAGKALLSVRYPVNSTWEFTLPNDEVAEGTVYCTDEVSQTVVLQKPLVHTTLTFEVRMVQVASIKKEKLVSSSTENSTNSSEESAPLSKPLPVIQKKVLEEREKKAIKLAEERFRHINQNVSFVFVWNVCELDTKVIRVYEIP